MINSEFLLFIGSFRPKLCQCPEDFKIFIINTHFIDIYNTHGQNLMIILYICNDEDMSQMYACNMIQWYEMRHRERYVCIYYIYGKG